MVEKGILAMIVLKTSWREDCDHWSFRWPFAAEPRFIPTGIDALPWPARK
jgi:hypothetical protein